MKAMRLQVGKIEVFHLATEGDGSPTSIRNHSDGAVQGYLDRKKQHPPKTLQQPYAQGPMVILWG